MALTFIGRSVRLRLQNWHVGAGKGGQLRGLFNHPSTRTTVDKVEAKFAEAVTGLQITSDYRALVDNYAGPLGLQVKTIFKGRSDLAYLLCDRSRRQVWNCVLSHLDILEAWKQDRHFAAALFTQLQEAKSDELIKGVYGTVPKGFIKALAKFGDIAQTAETYDNLHDLMKASPFLRPQIMSTEKLKASTLKLLLKLPGDLHVLQLVNLLTDHGVEKEFLVFVKAVERLPEESRTDTYDRLNRATNSFGSFERYIAELGRELPFPSPVLVCPEQVRHLSNETELELAGKYFNNCLGQLSQEAHSGKVQFYEWIGDEQGVFSIREINNHWVVSEVDFLDGTCERHWEMVRSFTAEQLGEPVGEQEISIRDATKQLLMATAWADLPDYLREA